MGTRDALQKLGVGMNHQQQILEESADEQSYHLVKADKLIRRLYARRPYVRVNIWEICDCLEPQVLRLIAENRFKWLSLNKIVNRLDLGSRFDFWRIVFENRAVIPQKELLQVWYDCLLDRGSILSPLVTTKTGLEEYGARVSNVEMQSNSVITNPLLIDDPIVSFRYCQVRKPGWEKLQYIHGRRHQTLKLSENVHQAIREDCLPVFAMNLDIQDRNVSFSLLAEVLQYGAVGIFRYLMENKMVAEEIITPSELCCYLATWFQDSISVPMLTVMEELHPGLVKDVKDVFGRNLLWFAVQNMKTGWFHPDCKLTPFLLEHGCDPQNNNQIGLPWQMVNDGLTMKLKEQMMCKRYQWEDYKAPNPYLLQLNQPLEKLRNPMHSLNPKN